MDPITFTFSPTKVPLPPPTTPLEASLMHLTSLIPTSDGLTSTLNRASTSLASSSKNLLLFPGNPTNPIPDLFEMSDDLSRIRTCAKELSRVRLTISRLDKKRRGEVLKELLKEAKSMKIGRPGPADEGLETGSVGPSMGVKARLLKVAMEIPCELEIPKWTGNSAKRFGNPGGSSTMNTLLSAMLPTTLDPPLRPTPTSTVSSSILPPSPPLIATPPLATTSRSPQPPSTPPRLSLSSTSSSSSSPPTPNPATPSPPPPTPAQLLSRALITPFLSLHSLAEKHPAGEVEKYCEDVWWVERVRVQVERIEERVLEGVLECVIAWEEERRGGEDWEDLMEV